MRFEGLDGGAQHIVHVDGLQAGRGHFRKVAETRHGALEFFQFRAERGHRIVKGLLKRLGNLVAGTPQIFHGDLQREKTLFHFVRQAARDFAPGGYALHLLQLAGLLGKFAGPWR